MCPQVCQPLVCVPASPVIVVGISHLPAYKRQRRDSSLQMIGFGVVNSFRLASSPLRQSMAPSQVSGKKMRTLLFGVILGIFAVVHSVTSDGKRNFFISLFFISLLNRHSFL